MLPTIVDPASRLYNIAHAGELAVPIFQWQPELKADLRVRGGPDLADNTAKRGQVSY